MRLIADTQELEQPAQPVGDALALALLEAADADLAEEAAAAGEELGEAAQELRARALARVDQARALVATQLDSSSGVRRRVVRTTADGELEPIPGIIGRYRVLRRLGAGAMGVVYAAHDEALDRDLAIKVLHGHVFDGSGRRRERLLREAQAMARVRHPNLVTVHEVGTANGQLFVAMEFVAGPTLERWLASEVRGWREIVAVFAQIADGLAALQDAGFVHRDVKPANVLVGDDGWVRVLDLGLVGVGSEERDSKQGSSGSWSSSLSRVDHALTKTGDCVGTPAYMSPEQFQGHELTPASDLFSLCVGLYEAVHGVHPFMARSFDELRSNVLAGRIIEPEAPTSAPAWLQALIRRGLTTDPEQRPGSMRELSAALTRDPGQIRRRRIGTVVVALLAALSGVLVAGLREGPATPVCEGGEATISAVWNPTRAEQLRTRMAGTQLAYAPALAERVVDGLDDYADAWARGQRRACEDHAAGRHSVQLLDARVACLDRRRQALSATVALLAEADADMVEHAGDMVAKLPRLDACDDLAALSDAGTAPVDPAKTEAREALAADLVRAEALANAGRFEAARDLTRAVAEEAEAKGFIRLQVRALLREARSRIVLRESEAVDEELERALALAIAEGFDELAAEAMIRRLYLRGLSPGGSEPALADVAMTEAMLIRAQDKLELRALLLNNVGAVELAAGHRGQARAAFERSLAVKEELYGKDHLELALSLANLAIVARDPERRQEHHERMIAIYDDQLGPDHPRTLDARLFAALHEDDLAAAGRSLAELCPRFAALGDPALTGECEFERGRRAYAAGELELARQAFAAADRQLGSKDLRRPMLEAYRSLDSKRPRRAIAALRRTITSEDRARAADWWVRLEQAERRVLLAQLLIEVGSPNSAVAPLERAIEDLEAFADDPPPVGRDRLLALARSSLALALVAIDGDRAQGERVQSLVAAARAHFLRWPRAYERRLAALDSI